MKVKYLTRKIRKGICAILTAVLVLMNTGVTTLAKEEFLAKENQLAEETTKEVPQTEETQQEIIAETEEVPLTEKELSEEETLEEGNSDAEETKDPVLEENVSDTEETATKEQTNEQDTENASEEDAATENATTEESIAVEESTEENSETDAVEEILKLEFSETDIADGIYNENGNDITWVIDSNGKLTVQGTGDYAPVTESSPLRIPWRVHNSKIKTAEINVQGMTNTSYILNSALNYNEGLKLLKIAGL